MSADDPELTAQLARTLKKRLDARLELLKLDRERLAARLAKMDDQIQEIEEDRESAIEKDLQRIQRSLGLNKRNPNRAGFHQENQQPRRQNQTETKTAAEGRLNPACQACDGKADASPPPGTEVPPMKPHTPFDPLPFATNIQGEVLR